MCLCLQQYSPEQTRSALTVQTSSQSGHFDHNPLTCWHFVSLTFNAAQMTRSFLLSADVAASENPPPSAQQYYIFQQQLNTKQTTKTSLNLHITAAVIQIRCAKPRGKSYCFEVAFLRGAQDN